MWKWVWGVISKIPDSDKHYFLCDWDTNMVLIPPVELLDDNFGVFKTPNGYHCYNFWMRLRLAEYLEWLELAGADPGFIKATKQRDFGTLEFKSQAEKNFMKDKSVCFLRFQRYIGGGVVDTARREREIPG